MLAKVVDASAAAALLFGEGEAELVARELDNADLIAPSLLNFELANVCLKKVRLHPGERDILVQAFAHLGELRIRTLDVAHKEALVLAERSGLSVYDASYLWLAMQQGAELVTLDKQLDKAASRLLMRPR